MKFSATIEFLDSGGTALITLFDSTGEWSGGGIVDIRSRSKADLYEAGYLHAARAARAKGGRVERFSEVQS